MATDTADLAKRILELYPALEGLPAPAMQSLLSRAAVVTLPAGTRLFQAGDACRQFPLVLAGVIRVAKEGEGRELQLYRVLPGESCVLTGSCLVGYSDYPATGVVEADATLVVLSRDAFEELMAVHAPFRQYVFGLFAARLADLMALVEAVAFHRLDRRIAAALLGHGRLVEATHQQLADEVGSVREIVTRVLRGFSDRGLVRLGRGSIEVLDAVGLRRAVAGE